jgi:ribonuclease HI
LTFVVAQGWAKDFAVELVSDSSIALEVAEGRYQPRAYPVVSKALRAAAVAARATTRKVRAHSGHRWNDAVDGLARAARLGAS